MSSSSVSSSPPTQRVPYRLAVARPRGIPGRGHARLVQPARDRPERLALYVPVAHLCHNRGIQRIGLVAPALDELARPVTERNLPAAVLPALTEHVPRITNAVRDRLALELREGRSPGRECTPIRCPEVDHGIEADKGLASDFEPRRKRHEIKQ
jgi:hypothetical protein